MQRNRRRFPLLQFSRKNFCDPIIVSAVVVSSSVVQTRLLKLNKKDQRSAMAGKNMGGCDKINPPQVVV